MVFPASLKRHSLVRTQSPGGPLMESWRALGGAVAGWLAGVLVPVAIVAGSGGEGFLTRTSQEAWGKAN